MLAYKGGSEREMLERIVGKKLPEMINLEEIGIPTFDSVPADILRGFPECGFGYHIPLSLINSTTSKSQVLDWTPQMVWKGNEGQENRTWIHCPLRECLFWRFWVSRYAYPLVPMCAAVRLTDTAVGYSWATHHLFTQKWAYQIQNATGSGDWGDDMPQINLTLGDVVTNLNPLDIATYRNYVNSWRAWCILCYSRILQQRRLGFSYQKEPGTELFNTALAITLAKLGFTKDVEKRNPPPAKPVPGSKGASPSPSPKPAPAGKGKGKGQGKGQSQYAR